MSRSHLPRDSLELLATKGHWIQYLFCSQLDKRLSLLYNAAARLYHICSFSSLSLDHASPALRSGLVSVKAVDRLDLGYEVKAALHVSKRKFYPGFLIGIDPLLSQRLSGLATLYSALLVTLQHIPKAVLPL